MRENLTNEIPNLQSKAMNLKSIDPDKILLIRWRDIIELHCSDLARDDEDYERIQPVLEIAGKIKTIRRGIVVVQPEWNLSKDFDDYDGHGPNTQLLPIGCIDSIYELKVGKKLYKNPEYEDVKSKDGGSTTATPATTEPRPSS